MNLIFSMGLFTAKHDAVCPSARDVLDLSDVGEREVLGRVELLLRGHALELAVLGVAPTENLAAI